MLPAGSRFRGGCNDVDAWDEQKYMLAEIIDRLDILACGFTYQREPMRFERPADHLIREETQRKAKESRKKIQETQWEEVENG